MSHMCLLFALAYSSLSLRSYPYLIIKIITIWREKQAYKMQWLPMEPYRFHVIEPCCMLLSDSTYTWGWEEGSYQCVHFHAFIFKIFFLKFSSFREHCSCSDLTKRIHLGNKQVKRKLRLISIPTGFSSNLHEEHLPLKRHNQKELRFWGKHLQRWFYWVILNVVKATLSELFSHYCL